jgi:hypothetical protein
MRRIERIPGRDRARAQWASACPTADVERAEAAEEHRRTSSPVRGSSLQRPEWNGNGLGTTGFPEPFPSKRPWCRLTSRGAFSAAFCDFSAFCVNAVGPGRRSQREIKGGQNERMHGIGPDPRLRLPCRRHVGVNPSDPRHPLARLSEMLVIWDDQDPSNAGGGVT